MDDDYYHLTICHSALVDGVHYANPECLICLKAKAFLDMTRRKAEEGSWGDLFRWLESAENETKSYKKITAETEKIKQKREKRRKIANMRRKVMFSS